MNTQSRVMGYLASGVTLCAAAEAGISLWDHHWQTAAWAGIACYWAFYARNVEIED